MAEQSPDYLLKLHNENNLENVFLKLCHSDDLAIDSVNPKIENYSNRIKKKISNGLSKSVQLPNWNCFLSILFKEFILSRRNIMLVLKKLGLEFINDYF